MRRNPIIIFMFVFTYVSFAQVGKVATTNISASDYSGSWETSENLTYSITTINTESGTRKVCSANSRDEQLEALKEIKNEVTSLEDIDIKCPKVKSLESKNKCTQNVDGVESSMLEVLSRVDRESPISDIEDFLKKNKMISGSSNECSDCFKTTKSEVDNLSVKFVSFLREKRKEELSKNLEFMRAQMYLMSLDLESDIYSQCLNDINRELESDQCKTGKIELNEKMNISNSIIGCSESELEENDTSAKAYEKHLIGNYSAGLDVSSIESCKVNLDNVVERYKSHLATVEKELTGDSDGVDSVKEDNSAIIKEVCSKENIEAAKLEEIPANHLVSKTLKLMSKKYSEKNQKLKFQCLKTKEYVKKVVCKDENLKAMASVADYAQFYKENSSDDMSFKAMLCSFNFTKYKKAQNWISKKESKKEKRRQRKLARKAKRAKNSFANGIKGDRVSLFNRIFAPNKTRNYENSVGAYRSSKEGIREIKKARHNQRVEQRQLARNERKVEHDKKVALKKEAGVEESSSQSIVNNLTPPSQVKSVVQSIRKSNNTPKDLLSGEKQPNIQEPLEENTSMVQESESSTIVTTQPKGPYSKIPVNKEVDKQVSKEVAFFAGSLAASSTEKGNSSVNQVSEAPVKSFEAKSQARYTTPEAVSTKTTQGVVNALNNIATLNGGNTISENQMNWVLGLSKVQNGELKLEVTEVDGKKILVFKDSKGKVLNEFEFDPEKLDEKTLAKFKKLAKYVDKKDISRAIASTEDIDQVSRRKQKRVEKKTSKKYTSLLDTLYKSLNETVSD